MRIIIEIDSKGSQPDIQLNSGSDSTSSAVIATASNTTGANATDAGAPAHISTAANTQAATGPDSFAASAIPDSIKAEATSAGAAPTN